MPPGKSRTDQTLKAYPCFSGLQSKGAMCFGRYADHEPPAVGAVRYRLRYLFVVGLHISMLPAAVAQNQSLIILFQLRAKVTGKSFTFHLSQPRADAQDCSGLGNRWHLRRNMRPCFTKAGRVVLTTRHVAANSVDAQFHIWTIIPPTTLEGEGPMLAPVWPRITSMNDAPSPIGVECL